MRVINTIMTPRLLLLGALALGNFSAPAVDRFWDGGANDNQWTNTLNWDGDATLPVEGTGSAGDTLYLDNAVSYAIYSAAEGARSYRQIRVGHNANGRLDVTGGTLTGDNTIQHRVGRSGFTGTVNISGTGRLRIGHIAEIGMDNNSVGMVNVFGDGTYEVFRGATKDTISNVGISLGAGGTGQGTLTVSENGRVYTRFGVLLGQLSGAGSGTFHVNGGASLSRIGGNNGANATDNGFWLQRANGTLQATVDSPNGFSLGTIDIYDAGASVVQFAAGAKLNPGFSGALPPATKSWDLMTFFDGVLTDNGLTLDAAAAAAGWSFAFVDARGNPAVDTLRITFTVSNSIVPIGLTAAPGLSQVELNWNAVSNAISYNVKGGTMSGGPYPVTQNVSSNSFTDTGLVNGTTYYYVVSAVTPGGESVDSTEASATPTRFVHPGGLFKMSDLERMRFLVQAGQQPWLTSFKTLQADSKASYTYTVRGNPAWTTVSRDPCINCSAFESDANAAYLNALMWAITQDTRHADKCVEIFNAWENLTEVRGGGTESLNAGLFAWKLVEAAEIIKSTYVGWSAADLQQFKAMLVYPGYSATAVPASVNNTNGTFYWRIYRGDPGRHGNQDLIAWRAMLSMGVFLDNEKMYDRALRYFKGWPGRPDDLPMPTGPSPSGSQVASNQYFIAYQHLGSQGTIPDYGYNGVLTNYVWESGQNQESSRDQQHAFFGLGICAGLAEVAWNQGEDVWNSHTNRLLLGFEFMARYNTSFIAPFPDQPTPWEPDNFIQRTDRTGRWFSQQINPHFESDFVSLSRGNFAGGRPVYEQAVAHFQTRMGLTNESLWTERSRDVAIAESGYEVTGWSLDHPGWGALTFRRPPLAAGDPISGFAGGLKVFALHKLPGMIPAENYDYFPAEGQGRTYFDQTPTNSGAAYRNDAVDIAVDAVEGFYLTDVAAGEWVSYTVNVPAHGNYGLAVRYAAASDGGTIRISSGTNDVTEAIALPATGGMANWSDHTLVSSIPLSAGVQVLRLHFGGAANLNVNHFTLLPALTGAPIGNGLQLSWPTNLPNWRLEAQTNSAAAGLSANWFRIPGSSSTNQIFLPINPANGSVFLRLVNP